MNSDRLSLLPYIASNTVSDFAKRPFVSDRAEGCSIALLGLPDDTGVQMNHGRVGAREGPRAFREALARYGADSPASGAWPRVWDVGDVIPSDDIHETHERVTRAVLTVVEKGLFPVIIGGGHDLTFAGVRGLVSHLGPVNGVYCDAHLDVRPEVGSGMSFRALVEQCRTTRLYLHGFQPFVNSKEHAEWFLAHGGSIGSFTPDGLWPTESLFFSFDIDVIDAAHAPGVSATNPVGWSPQEAERWVRAAGLHPNVRWFDLMELNPKYDIDGRTARLAAHLFLVFLSAFGQRRVKEAGSIHAEGASHSMK